MLVLSKDEIVNSIDFDKAYLNIKKGFRRYSEGSLTLSPINSLKLEGGLLHMKAGFVHGDSFFYAKLVTGFPANTTKNLPPGDGAILVFDVENGTLVGVLLDGGYLTDLRTALAVRYAIECYQPKYVAKVGVLGSGTQARLCAIHQSYQTGCKNILLWDETKKGLKQLHSN